MRTGVRVAITGPPGCGKTTLIHRIVGSLRGELAIGGIYTEEIREGGRRRGFAIVDIGTGRRGTLAHMDLTSGPRIGKYVVNLRDIEEIAIPSIEKAWRHKELLVIDEIAPMELASGKFVGAVEQALSSPKHILCSIHERSGHPLAARMRDEFTLYRVTRSNREQLPQELVGLFR